MQLQSIAFRKSALAALFLTALNAGAFAQDNQAVPGTPNVKDPWLAKWIAATPDRKPAALQAGVDYGMNPQTGDYVWPKATPEVHQGQPFPGEFKHWDKTTFTKNVKVLAFYPGVGSPFHAWNNIIDFDGKRYLYIHDRDYLRILDVTDPANAKVVYSQGAVWGPKGPSERWDAANVKDYQLWDMSDPANPQFVSQITVPGQVADDKASVFAYLQNPRAGNRASWMGARMPLFLPKPLEQGGKIGFGAMGGLGLWSFDLSDPANPKILSNVNTPPSFAGTEYDNADVSQYARTGYVFTSGYPMNRDCYEPYKDIFVVNAKNPAAMKVVTTLPRPTPPEGAPYTHFCQRGGNFGPKRSNSIGQPGSWRQNILPYSFYTAGVQMFDVSNPAEPKIAGYFVPPLADETELPKYTLGKGVLAMYTEYDRNIMWAFTENGAYALSSPLLGEPVLGAPAKPFPAR